jgi:pSer/pThr/pTyr-binding forkhead associated (FHA) protein
MATLQISLTDGEQTHELTGDLMTIGRVSDNSIQIEDGSVSSHHAQIVLRDGVLELEDLDSTNGTRVNGQRMNKTTLENGMRLRFGQVEAVFLTETGGEVKPLPQTEELEVQVAHQTKRPADFVNSSPFGARTGKKDGAGTAILALAVVAMLVAAVVIYLASTVKPPV